MPTTETPPRRTPSFPPPRPDASDLLDASRWESAYRELHSAPALILQLQDDLSRSRQREAFWISVVVHFIVIVLVLNADKLAKYLPKQTVIPVSPVELNRNKDLTYLELPSDVQKVRKRPDTTKMSDKDRIAASKTPKIDPREIKKLIEAGKAGAPKMQAPQQQRVQQQAPPQQQQQQPAPQPQQQSQQNQEAKLQPPPQPPQPEARQPNFNAPAQSAGSAIEQAAREALANRGSYGGSGDIGMSTGRQAPKALEGYDVLSDTMGVDFGPYLSRVLHTVRENWYRVLPESAMPPIYKKGKVAIEFAIMKDGSVKAMRLGGPSGDVALDRAAWAGITSSNPFPPLPSEFPGQYLGLRIYFLYNPDDNDLR